MKKLPAYKKKDLERQLSKIADSVSKKPVYVVKKAELGFDIVHYISDSLLIGDIPDLKIAKKIADKANSKRSLQHYDLAKINNRLAEYYKHYNDIQFFKHILSNSDDTVKKNALSDRLELSVTRMKIAKQKILG